MNLLEKVIEQGIEENPEKYEDWTPKEIEAHKKEIKSSIEAEIKREDESIARTVARWFGK